MHKARIVSLIFALMTFALPALAQSEYQLAPSELSLGEITSPLAIREIVTVKGVESGDQLKVLPRRGVGITAGPSLPNSAGQFGFDVLLQPTSFEPGSHEETIDVSVNGSEVAKLEIHFSIATKASAELLRSLIVYTREGDAAGFKAFQDKLSNNDNAYPLMQYKLDLRYIHIEENKQEYDELIAHTTRSDNTEVKQELPAAFVGPRLLGEGPAEVIRTIDLAIRGQNFLKPKPVINVASALPPQTILNEYVDGQLKAPAGIVFMAQQASAENLAGNEVVVSYPTNQGPRTWSGKLSNFVPVLRGLMGLTTAPDNTMTSPSGITSEGTAIATPAGTGNVSSSQTPADSPEDEGSTSWLSVLGLVLAGVLLLVVISLAINLRRQQDVLAQVSRRLDKAE